MPAIAIPPMGAEGCFAAPGQTLGAAEMSLLAAVIPPGWGLERHDSYDGTTVALLVCIEAGSPAYCVSRGAEGFCLMINREDDFAELGRFASATEMVVAVAGALWACPAGRRVR